VKNEIIGWKEGMLMDKKTKNTKAKKQSAVKMLKIKRETIKDLSGLEKMKIKGGGGKASGVVQSRVV
jgi:hypothetical protein